MKVLLTQGKIPYNCSGVMIKQNLNIISQYIIQSIFRRPGIYINEASAEISKGLLKTQNVLSMCSLLAI